MYCGTLRIAVQGWLLLLWCILGLVFAQDVTEGQVTMTTNASTEVPNNASQSTVLSDMSKFPHFDTGGLSMFLKGEPSPLSLGLVKLDRNLTFEFWFKADAYNAAGMCIYTK
ncbi:hypothetical protein SARC_10255 [Sphaeroforma arctica JP610]|uniref:Uncharacterized protein n=1 Tax=Sphaeroforma arctica JP610 TaxID=667725 RepID=A0A0L0FKI4_9EUKA|nr:hypothetical protein SARC_10255 [Sphaeroforma arctica JP610]KNC77289.1 hypothetical protein SARC_10255 [Sphaeroforma arctica JP610]|eukprot:XP_014151191.1 hypothetical protein SARC_10255 [Sphaeroforma arctica JP610]